MLGSYWGSEFARHEGGKLRVEFLCVQRNTDACRYRIRGWLGSMTEHLLSLVRGREGHFRLESGHHGDLWFQLETLCLHAREVQPFAAQLAAQLVQHKLQAVCGPPIQGAFVALLVSLGLGCAFVYAEPFADPTREGLFPVAYRLPT